MTYQIRYGLGGGFGGCKNKEWEDTDAKTEEQASDEAYGLACEEYDSYGGMHGLRTVNSIMEEDGVDEKEAESILEEEYDSWVDYEVRVKPEGI